MSKAKELLEAFAKQTDIFSDLLNDPQGEGDLNLYDSRIVANALKSGWIIVTSCSRPNRNIRLTTKGRIYATKNLVEVFAAHEPFPKTPFQKKYAKNVQFRNRQLWQFPGRFEDEGNLVEIPEPVRKGPGVEPSQFVKDYMHGAYHAAKDSATGYAHVQDIVTLTGVDKGTIHDGMIWMVRNGHASLSPDRMGKATYIKFHGSKE